jgi:hypothetical protein
VSGEEGPVKPLAEIGRVNRVGGVVIIAVGIALLCIGPALERSSGLLGRQAFGAALLAAAWCVFLGRERGRRRDPRGGRRARPDGGGADQRVGAARRHAPLARGGVAPRLDSRSEGDTYVGGITEPRPRSADVLKPPLDGDDLPHEI